MSHRSWSCATILMVTPWLNSFFFMRNSLKQLRNNWKNRPKNLSKRVEYVSAKQKNSLQIYLKAVFHSLGDPAGILCDPAGIVFYVIRRYKRTFLSFFIIIGHHFGHQLFWHDLIWFKELSVNPYSNLRIISYYLETKI